MLEILNTSIAVTAAAHNPSILHPSFLSSQHIVPEDWELADPPLCTPALSVVKFANGVVLTVEGQKLQVLDNEPAGDAAESAIPGVVERYTQVLPHVRYTAVGINITGFIPAAAPNDLLSRFLAPGPWNEGELKLESLGIRFVYSVLETRLRLAFDGGTVQTPKSQSPTTGVIIAANYHSDLTAGDATTAIATSVRRFKPCFDHFRETVAAILELRSEHATH